MPGKRCRNCGTAEDVRFSPSSKYICRICYNAYRNGWRATRRERERELDRARWARSPERRRKKTAAAMRWFAAHPDKVAENHRRMAAWKIEYLRTHPGVRCRAQQNYFSKPENRARRMTLSRLYAARRRGASGTHTHEQWLALCVSGRCVYCGERRALTRDHIIPISRGGSNDISNIAPACGPCNSRKQTMTAAEFMSARKVA